MSTPPPIYPSTPLFVGLSISCLYMSPSTSLVRLRTPIRQKHEEMPNQNSTQAGQFSCRRRGDEINKPRAGSRKPSLPGAWHGMARSCIRYIMRVQNLRNTSPARLSRQAAHEIRLAFFSALFFFFLYVDRESIAWAGGLLFCIGKPDGGQGSRRALYNRICWSVRITSLHRLSRARWMSPRKQSETLTTVVFSFAFFFSAIDAFLLGLGAHGSIGGEGIIPGVLETRDVGFGKETYGDSTVSNLRISGFLGSVFFSFLFSLRLFLFK